MTEKLQEALNQINDLLDKRLHVSGAPDHRLVQARRFLSRKMRRDAATLIEVHRHLDHPRLSVTLDEAALLRKARGLHAYLEELDLAERRRGRWLDFGATLGFALLSCLALLIIVLRWRGFV